MSSLHLVSKSARIGDSWYVTYLQNAAFDTTYTKTSYSHVACQEPSLRDTRPALIDLLCVPRAISQPDTEGPSLTGPAKLFHVSCEHSSEHSAFKLRPSGVGGGGGVTRTEYKPSAGEILSNRQVWKTCKPPGGDKRIPAHSGRHVGGSSPLWKDCSSNICLYGSAFLLQLLKKDEKYKHGKRKTPRREPLKCLSIWRRACPFFVLQTSRMTISD